MGVCVACGMETPNAARFCMGCGTPLEGEPQAERRERRIVSVLFADLVGFTGRSERLDVEDVERFLAPYQALLVESVERTGGVITKFLGDGVMALFGALIAHEDDPERAVRCGISIREALAASGGDEERRLQVRIGVATGEALVAVSESGQTDAIGDIVNTAARLESPAPIDGILVDEWTYRATDRAIRYAPTEAVLAKGKADPVPAWRAIAARSAVPEQHRGDDVKLVGRDDELGQLLAVLGRSKKEPSTQLVTVVGQPGIGKSRLLRELYSHVENDLDLVRWRRGRSLAYGEAVALWALGEMVKSEAGILESDPTDIAAQKLGHAVEAVIDDERDRAWVSRYLRPLVGLDADSAERGHIDAAAAWRRFFEALAEDRPTVAVFEDIHWADDALRDFVDLLAERLGDVPLLIVCTARPELLERRPMWGGGKGNATTISLAPLSEAATGQFVEELLRSVHVPEVVRQTLSAQADGNPLYAQEYVRMLRDKELLVVDGADWQLADEPDELPESVHGIIAARLDTLSVDERAFVHDAAVVGRTAWVGAVCALSGTDAGQMDDVLHGLERKQLLRRVRHSSLQDEVEVVFAHALVQDVAYAQISRPDRARKHEHAAAWIERSAGVRDDRAELLAHHYSTALQLHREIGDETEASIAKARAALVAAGRQADAVNGYAAAARHYAAAVDLMSPDDPERPDVLYALAVASFHANNDEAPRLLAQAVDVLEAAKQWRPAAEAAELYGEWTWERNDYDDAEAWFAHAERISEACGHEYVLGRIAECRSATLINVFRPAEAVAVAERGKERARLANEPEIYALLLRQAGAARVLTGDESGVREVAEATDLLAQMGSRYAAWGYIDLCQSLAITGDFNSGRVACDDGVAWAERFGETRVVHDVGARRALFAYHAGDWETARQISGTYVRAAHPQGRWLYLWIDTSIAIAEGAPDDVIDAAFKAVELQDSVNSPGEPLTMRTLQAVRAEALGKSDAVAADAAIRAVDDLPIIYCTFELSELLAVQSHHDEIRRTAIRLPETSAWRRALMAATEGRLADAADIYERMGSHPLAARMHLLAADRAHDQGRTRESRRHAERALAFYGAVGASLYADRAAALMNS